MMKVSTTERCGRNRGTNAEITGSVEPGVSGAAASGGAGSKIKHPNQYTYRPKTASTSQPPVAVSPARRGAGTPVPSIAPPQHDHGTRRAGAIANGAIAYPTLSVSSSTALSWYLPEHLSAFSDLLPSSQPVALDVRSQRTLPSISRNHYHNQRYGPFSETRDEEGKLCLPDDPPMREPTGEAETHLEPPARVKYPVKRITVGEMRKRVRSILEYVSKVQGTEEKRIERNKTLGVVVTPLPKKATPAEDKEDQNIHDPVDADGDITMEPPVADTAREKTSDDTTTIKEVETNTTTRSSTELMEELTRDLLAFQETFAANGIVSPMPPPIATFDPPLSLPVPDVQPDHEPKAEVGLGIDIADPKLQIPDGAATEVSLPLSSEADPLATLPDEEPEALPSESVLTADPQAGVVDHLDPKDALDVYRTGQVDAVISQPEEEEVVAAPAPEPDHVAAAETSEGEAATTESTPLLHTEQADPLPPNPETKGAVEDTVPTEASPVQVEEPAVQQDVEMAVDSIA